MSGVGDHQILKCGRVGGGFKKGACHKILCGEAELRPRELTLLALVFGVRGFMTRVLPLESKTCNESGLHAAL